MPFQKGQSGNPSGGWKSRRNSVSLTRIMHSQLKTIHKGSGIKYAQAIVSAILDAAVDKQPWACNAVLERVDGKVPDQLHVSQEPVVLRIESNAGIPRLPIPVGPTHLIEARKVEEEDE